LRSYRQKQKANKQLSIINEQLERLSIVASETDNAVIIADAAGNIEWVNAGFTKITGYTLEEYKKEKGENLKQVSANPEIEKLINECIETKKSVVYEMMNTTKEGREIWVQTTLTPILAPVIPSEGEGKGEVVSEESPYKRGSASIEEIPRSALPTGQRSTRNDNNNNKGEVKNLVAIDSDITDRKKAEQQVIKQNEELAQMHKDITDSIIYASRIQQALFPPGDALKELFPDTFILEMPRDIVGGDFHWFVSPPLTPSPPETEKRGIGETERRKTKRFTHSPIHPFTHSPIR